MIQGLFFIAPAIHLLSLKVASIFEQLDIVEEEVDHCLCFFQICLHLRHVLSRFPRALHPHNLQHINVAARHNDFWGKQQSGFDL